VMGPYLAPSPTVATDELTDSTSVENGSFPPNPCSEASFYRDLLPSVALR